MSARALAAGLCLIVATVAWSTRARAFEGYPAVVDTWLGTSGLVEMFEKPMGCQLCHVSDQGGTVELKPFGSLLVASYGLPRAAEQDTALMGALAGLRAANPALYVDLQHGIDPNDDPALTAQALPQPEHGCSATPTGLDAPSAPAALIAIATLAGARRRSRHVAPPA